MEQSGSLLGACWSAPTCWPRFVQAGSEPLPSPPPNDGTLTMVLLEHLPTGYLNVCT